MIVVVGSSNTELSVISDTRLPDRGETVHGDFFMTMGGKGALQAVGAARLGQEVYLLASIGQDEFGRNTVATLKKEKVHADYIFTDQSLPSGVAVSVMDPQGERVTALAAGANSALCPEHVLAAADLIREADILLCELSVRMDTITTAVEIAHQGRARVVLTPSPAHHLEDDFLRSLDVILPNETEAETLTGVSVNDMMGAEEAAPILSAKGTAAVVITMGKRGTFMISGSDQFYLPARKVMAVDPTGAGDTYSAAIAVALAEKRSLREAITFATYASALAVTRRGAQAALPYRDQLDAFTRRQDSF